MAVVFIFHKVSVHEYSITVTAMVIIITGILPIYGCGQTASFMYKKSLWRNHGTCNNLLLPGSRTAIKLYFILQQIKSTYAPAQKVRHHSTLHCD